MRINVIARDESSGDVLGKDELIIARRVVGAHVFPEMTHLISSQFLKIK